MKHRYTTKKELESKIYWAEKLFNLIYGQDYDFIGCRTNSEKYSVVAHRCLLEMERENKEYKGIKK